MIKRQFADRQILLLNTAHSLKFLEDYVDGQTKLWQVLQQYNTLPDKLEDLYVHFAVFKSSIQTDFRYLKQVSSQNIHNIQSILSIQQTYSSTLSTHSKLTELQKQIQQHCMYPYQTDTVQIDAPEYDSDIDGDNSSDIKSKWATVSVQEILDTYQELPELLDYNSTTPDSTTPYQDQIQTNWPGAPAVQILGVSLMTGEAPPEVTFTRCTRQHTGENQEIPELEEDYNRNTPSTLTTS